MFLDPETEPKHIFKIFSVTIDTPIYFPRLKAAVTRCHSLYFENKRQLTVPQKHPRRVAAKRRSGCVATLRAMDRINLKTQLVYNRRYPLHRFAASRLRASLRSWGNKKIVVTHVTIVMLIPVTIFTPGVREAGEAVIVSLPWECADSVALTDLSTKIVSCEIIETRLIRVDFTHFLYGLCKLAC